MPRPWTGRPRGRPPGIHTKHESKVAAGMRARAEREYQRARSEALAEYDATHSVLLDRLDRALEQAEQTRRAALTPPALRSKP